MPRYIDADKLYSRVKTHTNPYGKPTIDYDSGVKVLNMIKTESTADVVEVVRCKDYIYFQPDFVLTNDKNRRPYTEEEIQKGKWSQAILE